MATFDYAEMVALADELVAEFGQTASLSQPGATTGDAWSPTPGTPTVTSVTVVDINERTWDAAALVGRTTRTILLSTSAGVVPTKGDTITLGGTSHEIAEVRTTAPGGTTVLYELELAA